VTAFNRHTVKEFFDNLQLVCSRHHYDPASIYNADESGLTTVQKPVAGCGHCRLWRKTSRENNIGRKGNSYFIYPRVNFKKHMIAGGPAGCVGVANPSVWMNAVGFHEWINHFIKHVKCSQDAPVILILDNHESHITIEVLDTAKNNGITMISLPPHCSHKLQPLDRSVFGPLKRFYNASGDSWMLSNARPITIFYIARIVRPAYDQAFSKASIESGFLFQA